MPAIGSSGQWFPKTKRPARGRPFVQANRSKISTLRSVPGDHRATEGVVHADGAHVDVLTDVVPAVEDTEGVERHVAAAHEQMVVFERDGPARREAELDAGADRAAPTGLAGGIESDAGEK